MNRVIKDSDFNRWLAKEVKKQGLNQRDLADLSDIDHSSISRLLNHDRIPSLYTTIQLVEALGYQLLIVKDEQVYLATEGLL